MRVERIGIPISPGVALGKVVLLDRSKTIVEGRTVAEEDIVHEKERFLAAVLQSKQELVSLKEKIDSNDAGDHLQIINFNIMMLEDDLLSEEVTSLIESERFNAE